MAPFASSAVVSAFSPNGSYPSMRTGPCDDAQLVCSYLVIFSEENSVHTVSSCGVNS